MMPSRGLHLARLAVPKMGRPQSRSLSSAILPQLRSSTRHIAPCQPLSVQWRRLPPAAGAVATVGAVRLASSNAADAPTSGVASQSSFSNLDTITLDNLEASSASEAVTPNEIGYLHQLGLDYGWGPSSMLEWVLEHVHVYSGMPWWGSILVTAVGLRVALAPLFIAGSDSAARQSAMAPVLRPWQDRMSAAQKRGDTADVMMCWQEMGRIRKEAGVSVWKQVRGPLVQGVLGYCGFKLVHAMAVLPVPEFATGGFLWFSDLTLTDGYLALPALMALAIHTTVRMGGETGTASGQLPPMVKNIFLYVMPAFMFLFLSWQPAAVALWFSGTGAVGIVQGQLLQRSWVRERLGISPIYKPPAGEKSMWETLMPNQFKSTSTASTSAASASRTINTSLVNKKPSTVGDMIQPRQERSSIFSSLMKSATSAKTEGVAEQVSKQKPNFNQAHDGSDRHATSSAGPTDVASDAGTLKRTSSKAAASRKPTAKSAAPKRKGR